LHDNNYCNTFFFNFSMSETQLLPACRMASASMDCRIELWALNETANEMAANVPHSLVGHTNAVSALELLPGDKLASGSFDNTIRIWSEAI
jgi:WD40 repeat protein